MIFGIITKIVPLVFLSDLPLKLENVKTITSFVDRVQGSALRINLGMVGT